MVVFILFNLFIRGIVGNFITMGDGSADSYHMFTYIGLVTLCGVIITCTFIIIEKLDDVKRLFNIKQEK